MRISHYIIWCWMSFHVIKIMSAHGGPFFPSFDGRSGLYFPLCAWSACVLPWVDCAIATVSHRWASSAWRSSTILIVDGHRADPALEVPLVFPIGVPVSPPGMFPRIFFPYVSCDSVRQCFVFGGCHRDALFTFQAAYHAIGRAFLLSPFPLPRSGASHSALFSSFFLASRCDDIIALHAMTRPFQISHSADTTTTISTAQAPVDFKACRWRPASVNYIYQQATMPQPPVDCIYIKK